MKIMIIATLLTLVSCSDATQGAFKALGKTRDIKCYSGGVLVYSGKTTGKIENEPQSDGHYFTDTNGVYVETTADCMFMVQE